MATPLGGTQPSTTARLSRKPRPEHQGHAVGREPVAQVVLGQGHPEGAPQQDADAEKHQGHADESQFLADHGHDEVVVGLGQVEELLFAGPEADAGDAARTEGVEGLHELVTDVCGSLNGIEEGEPAFEAVGRGGDQKAHGPETEHQGHGQGR